MTSKCLIQKQIDGLPIANIQNYKVEYQLRAQSGRTVISFDREERARQEAKSRGLTCFRVTTITQQL